MISIVRTVEDYRPVCNLVAVTVPQKIKMKVELRDVWVQTPVLKGDIINIVWTKSLPPHVVSMLSGRTDSNILREPKGVDVVVDQYQHYLVLCPDVLVSPTRVTGSLQCIRRSILAEQVQSYCPSKFTAMGNAKHEMIERGNQHCLLFN